MNTVITHFHNEEYLLPWWINHHKKLFDYGIMINYGSTDRSVEICKELCPPNWKIIDSVNEDFEPNPLDKEVMVYENNVEGFKIALTVTEFLITPIPLNDLNTWMLNSNINCIKTWGVAMVDMFPNELPTYDKSLIEQKHHGMITGYEIPNSQWGPDPYNTFYGRFYHNKPFLNYDTGRHNLKKENWQIITDVYTLKYKYSPWNPATIKRVQQFAGRIPPEVKSLHKKPEQQHWVLYDIFRSTAYDLRTNPQFFSAFNYCRSVV
jgi:hypothetical protein